MSSTSSLLHTDTLLILLFHGVIPKQTHEIRNYTSKHITRDHFLTTLRALKEAGGIPISMNDVLEYHRLKKPWPPKAFVVSFDDGFENNYSVAAPILDDLKIPAIFYVTTQFIQAGLCSWIDQIEYAIEKNKVFDLNIDYLRIQGRFESVPSKIELLKKIRERVKSRPDLDPYHVSMDIWNQLHVTEMEMDPALDRKMSWNQVQKLESQTLFTVGGHGDTHQILSHLPPAQLEKELDTSFELLRTHLPKPPIHYSYPEGLESCYSSAVVEALKKRGIQCCPSAVDGVNEKGHSLFDLKRVMVT